MELVHVRIEDVVATGAPPRSRRAAFNKLSQKLRKLRGDHEEWDAAAKQFGVEHDAILQQTCDALVALQIQAVLAVEHQMQTLRLPSTTLGYIKLNLRTLILGTMQMTRDPAKHAQLIEIYDRHSQVPFADRKRREWLDVARQMGLDPGLLDGMPEEAIAEAIRRQAQANDEARSGGNDRPSSPYDNLFEALFGARGKSSEDCDCPRCQARRREKERAAASPAKTKAVDRLREIYRKMVRNLHPDREQDPALRSRKTELMQAVNVAYQNQDMLALLDLQVELGMLIDSGSAEISDDFLTDLMENVRRHIASIEIKIKAIKTQVLKTASDNCELPDRLSLKSFPPALKRLRESCDLELEDLREDIADIRHMDAFSLVAWLRDQVQA